jgi:urease accessory protein
MKPSVWVMRPTSRLAAGAVTLGLSIPLSARAHHPMGSQTPGTGMEGLLSGLGHPLIEAGHLGMVLGLALLLALLRTPGARILWASASLAVSSLIGTLLTAHLGSPDGLPWGIALSLWGLALAIWTERRVSGSSLLAGTALLGVVHGLAYGEAVIGAEAAPLITYLIGIGLLQLSVITITAHVLGSLLARPEDASVSRYRLGSASATIALVILGIQGLFA